MTVPLKFGLFSVNMDACADPATPARVARAAEAAGFESLWAAEHVVLLDPQLPPSPMAPTDRILDPVVALTFLASHTTRVRLGTGGILLPQRHPLVLARELASLDALSGGRLVVGVGAGYLEPELRALGVPMAERGARTDEYVAAMRSIWTKAQPAYEGRFVAFAGAQAHPRRAIPVVVVGHSPPPSGEPSSEPTAGTASRSPRRQPPTPSARSRSASPPGARSIARRPRPNRPSASTA